jgi:6-phosphogluconolactonase (cycloisomerase 2 family)
VLSYANNQLQLLVKYRISNNPENFPSEVACHNKQVVVANRGDNTVVVFEIPQEGTLKERFRFRVGDWPRHFKMTKSDQLYVACQKENMVQVYRFANEKVIHSMDIAIAKPSCVGFEELI